MRYLGHAQERQSDANATGETPDNCLYQSAGDILRFTVVTLAACLAATNSAVGQWMGRQTGCYADSRLQADKTSANARLRLRRQNTFRQHGRWFRNGERGSRIYPSSEQRYRTVSFRFQRHSIPDRKAEYVRL